MSVIFSLVGFVLLLFLVCLIVRLVFDWVQFFARDWRPRGVVLVIAEGVYTVTDPPLRALRRIIPPLTLGSVRLDLAFLVLFLATSILMQVANGLAASL
ncbi:MULTISPECIES: YggT family protein [Isoptericola]|uniref:YggT family protein n=1 Tax=Isoptericola sediminis TaxID=2733572 RepID=A0A849K826_9MICO|nr:MULTISPECIES: YggT family protein [unclassified Isoptericola]MDO8144674.1 YggT family protein [Isoptericola sp. 178]MDO8148520.1 YggT family protein [Isoptericola sp. b515]NNU28189.1 YggT family protein [Isoptericola sediminis]